MEQTLFFLFTLIYQKLQMLFHIRLKRLVPNKTGVLRADTGCRYGYYLRSFAGWSSMEHGHWNRSEFSVTSLANTRGISANTWKIGVFVMKKYFLTLFFLFFAYNLHSQVLIALLLGNKLNTGWLGLKVILLVIENLFFYIFQKFTFKI